MKKVSQGLQSIQLFETENQTEPNHCQQKFFKLLFYIVLLKPVE